MNEYNTELIPQMFAAMNNSSLSAEDRIKMIFQNPDWFSYVNERLSYMDFVMPENCQESLDYLIECYTNKKSKHVKYAGDKLKKVFLKLPPVEQHKVGMALLTGGKMDTEWICKRLNNYKPIWHKEWEINWHPCYAELIEKVWNKYRGSACGKLLIQFLDTETVRNHLFELMEDDELYFYICRRFVKESWFTIDAERLSKNTNINAYLSIMSQTSTGISEKEAEKLLYQWIATIASLIKRKSDKFIQFTNASFNSNSLNSICLFKVNEQYFIAFFLKPNLVNACA